MWLDLHQFWHCNDHSLCGRTQSFDRVRIDNDINHIEQKQPSITRQNVKIDKNRPKTVNITGFWLSTQVLRQTHYIWVTYRFYYKRMFFFDRKSLNFFFEWKKTYAFNQIARLFVCYVATSTAIKTFISRNCKSSTNSNHHTATLMMMRTCIWMCVWPLIPFAMRLYSCKGPA